jgi:hypothetical protein
LLYVTRDEALVPHLGCRAPRPLWSPGGRRYVLFDWAAFHVRRLPKVELASVRPPTFFDFDWTPGGASLTVTRQLRPGAKALVELPIGTGEPRRVAGPFDDIEGFEWAPGGKTIYFNRWVAQPGRYEVWRTIRGGRTSHRVSRGVLVDLSRDGRRLLIRDADALWIRRARATGRRLLVRGEGRHWLGPAAWSPDGRWIFLAGRLRSGDPHYFRVVRADGRVRIPIRAPELIGEVRSVSWRPMTP